MVGRKQERIKIAKESLTFHPSRDSIFLFPIVFSHLSTCSDPGRLCTAAAHLKFRPVAGSADTEKRRAFSFCLSWSLEQKSTHRMLKWKIIQNTKDYPGVQVTERKSAKLELLQRVCRLNSFPSFVEVFFLLLKYRIFSKCLIKFEKKNDSLWRSALERVETLRQLRIVKKEEIEITIQTPTSRRISVSKRFFACTCPGVWFRMVKLIFILHLLVFS